MSHKYTYIQQQEVGIAALKKKKKQVGIVLFCVGCICFYHIKYPRRDVHTTEFGEIRVA